MSDKKKLTTNAGCPAVKAARFLIDAGGVGGGILSMSVSPKGKQMRPLAPPPRFLQCCRRKPITPPQPYKRPFSGISSQWPMCGCIADLGGAVRQRQLLLRVVRRLPAGLSRTGRPAGEGWHRTTLNRSTLLATCSKADVANNVVVVNGCLLDFLRIHPPGQVRPLIAAPGLPWGRLLILLN